MIVIGRKDKIDLPELQLFEIEAKIDTGAYGSVVHCHQIELISKNGRDVLTYKVLDPTHPEYRDKVQVAEDFRDKEVKSSNGVVEHRYTINTNVLIFGQMIRTEFSLTDRMEMKHPVLLGRKFLKDRFLVNVKLKDLSHKHKQKTL